jgi:hypothetical protein
MSCNFRIVGAAKLTEGGNSVLLANLKSDNGSVGEVLDERKVLGEHTLVDIVKFLDDGTRQVEELHGRDLKTSRQDHVDNLTSFAFALNVGLDEAESAVVKDSSGLHRSLSGLLASKPEVVLALVGSKRVGAMNGILSAIGTESCADRLGSRSLSIK